MLKCYIEPSGAPSLLLLLADGSEMVPLSWHEVKGTALWKSHVYPLEKVKLTGKVAVPLRLHCGVLLLTELQQFQARVQVARPHC